MYLVAILGSGIALWYLLVIAGGLLIDRNLLPDDLLFIYEILRDSWNVLMAQLVALFSHFF